MEGTCFADLRRKGNVFDLLTLFALIADAALVTATVLAILIKCIFIVLNSRREVVQ